MQAVGFEAARRRSRSENAGYGAVGKGEEKVDRHISWTKRAQLVLLACGLRGSEEKRGSGQGTRERLWQHLTLAMAWPPFFSAASEYQQH